MENRKFLLPKSLCISDLITRQTRVKNSVMVRKLLTKISRLYSIVNYNIRYKKSSRIIILMLLMFFTFAANVQLIRFLLGQNLSRRNVVKAMPPSGKLSFDPFKIVVYTGPEPDFKPNGGMVKCQDSNCEVSFGDEHVDSADVVLFSPTKLKNFKMLVNLRRKNPDQLWGYLSLKPVPINSVSRYLEVTRNLQSIVHLFNFTISYRSDSDVKVGLPRFREVPCSKKVCNKTNLMERLSESNRGVVWVPTNCQDITDAYVNSLRSSLNIDIHGVCGTSVGKCSGQVWSNMTNICKSFLKENYLFAMVVDESFSKDYASPDIGSALLSEMIPITLTGKYLGSFANYSLIKASSGWHSNLVATVEEAKKMKVENLYEQFFSWREKYTLVPNDVVCSLCDSVNDLKLKVHSIKRIPKEWIISEFNVYHDWRSFLEARGSKKLDNLHLPQAYFF